MAIEILPTDTAFNISPDAGHPLCTCSRCNRRIKENEGPLRCLTTNEQGEYDESGLEYRYCEKCQATMGVLHSTIPDNNDFDCDDCDDRPE